MSSIDFKDRKPPDGNRAYFEKIVVHTLCVNHDFLIIVDEDSYAGRFPAMRMRTRSPRMA